MRLHRLLIATASALLFSASSMATVLPTAEAVKAKVPDVGDIKSVKSSPVPGVFEVVTDKNVFYISANLDYIFMGHLLDVNAKKSLTDPLLKEVRAKAAADITQKQSELKPTIVKALANEKHRFLVEKRGSGARELYVVSDIRCGFCKRFEETLEKTTDVTIYRIPVAFLGPESLRAGSHAVCAKDPVTAWKEYSADITKVPAGNPTCEKVGNVAAGSTLAKALLVRGTPAMFKADGDRWDRGFLNETDLNTFLNKGSEALAK